MNFPTGPLIAAWLILAGGGQTQETQKQAALERSAKKGLVRKTFFESMFGRSQKFRGRFPSDPTGKFRCRC